MANKPIPSNPIADLPANWVGGQIVSPNGTEVGLSQKYGYNYLNSKVNEALADLKLINDAFPGLAETDDVETLSTKLTDLKMLGWTVPEEMPIQNYTLNGVYHQRVGRVDLGSLVWGIAGESNNTFWASVSSIKNDGKLYCTKYVTRNFYDGNFEDKSIFSHEKSPLIKDSSYTDVAAFKSANSGIYLYYELETEITRTVDGNEWTARISNPNLLDNPWFTVNQRGVTSWAIGYGIDRWKAHFGQLTLTSNGLLIPAGVETLQFIENPERLNGMSVVLSILLSDGTIESTSPIVFKTDDVEYYTTPSNLLVRIGVYGSWSLTSPGVLIYNASSSAKIIKAVKLELGSASTLANDVAPNEAEELARCQRYFQRIVFPTNNTIGFGLCPNDTTVFVDFILSAPMRDSAITFSYSGNAYIEAEGSVKTPTQIVCAERAILNHLSIRVSADGLQRYKVYGLFSGGTDGITFNFSADL